MNVMILQSECINKQWTQGSSKVGQLFTLMYITCGVNILIGYGQTTNLATPVCTFTALPQRVTSMPVQVYILSAWTVATHYNTDNTTINSLRYKLLLALCIHI